MNQYITLLLISFAALSMFACDSAAGDSSSCTDGILNGDETGLDCGGVCTACGTCDDGAQNGDETGIDCGGSCGACPNCSDGLHNGDEQGIDCGGSCPASCAACTDGVQNGGETGVDCGGICSACATCEDGFHNGDETGVDCGGPCAPCPTCVDELKNGDETGVDCGGSCPACTSCNDRVQNGAETGVDCGGPCGPCPTCFDGVRNGGEAGVDCGGPCQKACPSCSDSIKNGSETGIDCGGPCPACVNCVPNAKRVFVTSVGYNGDLATQGGAADGLAGGDALCALHASAEGLGGTWRAWLSSADADAVDRVADVGPWYFVNRCTKAVNSLATLVISGPNVLLAFDEKGANLSSGSRWTGTTKSGRSDGLTCGGWTSPYRFEGLVGLGGQFEGFPEFWTAGPSNPCYFENQLICFEQ